jgi:predicted PurR-regulated permease PerM
VQVLLAPANIWRAGLVLAAVVAAAFFVRFVLVDAGSLIAMLVMAWFLSLAMEPAVRRLSRRVRRGYVSSRLVLATINGVASALVFLVLGMPSWLALGAWTGLVAQLVPTIGTYISIALPVVVGLVSPRPWIGLAALGWGVLYQQVENLTLEPKISSRAVDIHPGVSFAAVILGASLFGAMGALLAIPVVAMLHSLVDTFVTRQELQESVATRVPPPTGGKKPPPPK